MKLLALLFLTLFVGKGCSNTDDLKNTRIEYTAISRGYYQQIVVSNQGMVVQTGREGSEKKTISISEKDWKALVANFQSSNPKAFFGWRCPSTREIHSE